MHVPKAADVSKGIEVSNDGGLMVTMQRQEGTHRGYWEPPNLPQSDGGPRKEYPGTRSVLRDPERPPGYE